MSRILAKLRLHGITAKTVLGFAVLAVLLALEGGVNFVVLRSMRQAEDRMVQSMEIRQRIFEMDGELEKARRLQRDFFIRYPEIGFTQALELYFTPSQLVIAKVVALSEEFRGMIESTPRSHPLENRLTEINLYLSTAQRFADTFGELVELMNELAAPVTGLQGQLEASRNALREHARQHVESLLIFERMAAFEQSYWLSRKRSDLQAALNEAVSLANFLQTSAAPPPDRAGEIRGRVEAYQRTAREIMIVDGGIQSKFNDFNLQAKAVDPISSTLKGIASSEVEVAQVRIGKAFFISEFVIAVMAGTGFVAVIVVGMAVHSIVTRRITALTAVAEEMRKGNLQLRMESGGEDEIDDLALAMNEMAAQLQGMVGHLEEMVQERTRELTHARDELQEAVRDLDVKNRMLEILSRTDRLTSLANRRRLEESLHAEVLRSKRYEAPLSVIMIDLDRFKEVNDTFGHQVGDTVLVSIAEILKRNARETDVLGRWGGEEFLLICPETPLGLCGEIAERLRRDLSEWPVPEVGIVTASFGVAAFEKGDDQFSLLRKADEAMYVAKSKGRNRVEYG